MMKQDTIRCNRRRWQEATLAVLLLASALAPARAGAQKTAEPAVPADWIGHELGLEPPQLEYVRRAKVVEPTEDRIVKDFADVPADLRTAPESPSIAGGEMAVVAVHAETGDVYHLKAPAAVFERLHEAMEARGLTGPTPTARPAGEVDERAVPDPDVGRRPASARRGGPRPAVWDGEPGDARFASWSGGAQSFTRRGVADGWSWNHSTYQRIGQFGGACSGALVGPRHVLTAAHCLVDRTDGTVYSTTFRARRDWTQGTPSPTQPYGSRSGLWYYFPLAYWDGSACNSAWSCNRYDIAVAVLTSNVSAKYMGYWYAPVSTLQTWTKYNRGYPRCLTFDSDGDPVPDVEAPPSCTRSTLYGDQQTCGIGAWTNPGPDGYNRELWVNCDGCRGMSGSPMYTYASPGGLVALGVYSHFLCFATNCQSDPNGDFPNIMTRVTPEYAGFISMAKSLWSCASGACS